MPLACTAERVICFSEGAECALTLSSIPGEDRQVKLATMECLGTDGMCFRMMVPDAATESMPLYITSQGRCIFNGVDVVDDTNPDISTSAVRVHGVIKADGYIGLPPSIQKLETNPANGSIMATWSDNTTTSTPILSGRIDQAIQDINDYVKEAVTAINNRLDAFEARIWPESEKNGALG